MRLTTRIVAGSLLVAILTIVVLIGGAERVLRGSLEERVRADLGREAKVVGTLLASDPSTKLEALTMLQSETGHRVVVRRSDGRVLTVGDSITTPNAIRVVTVVGTDTVLIVADGQGVDQVVHLVKRAMVRAALLALLVVLISAWLTGQTIRRSLQQLTEAARSISTGSQLRLPASSVPEIESLSQALRKLHRRLADRSTDLERERSSGVELLEAMADGVIAVNDQGHPVIVNSAARALLGYRTDEELPGLRTLFRNPDALAVVAAVLDRHEPAAAEVTRDGRVLALRARPVSTGGAVMVLADLSDLRHLEGVRRDFIANLSHELKTPLTSIRASTEMLADSGIDAADRDRFLGMIDANARRMQSMAEDLLDLAKVESSRSSLEVAPLDLAKALNDAWRPCAPLAEQRGIAFTIEVGADVATLVADAESVRQVFENLFDNALRHVDQAGTIAVTAGPEHQGIRIDVTDNGTGIAPEHHSRIFERFYRVDAARSRAEGGTGLGLAIVRHLVEAHGGRVGVDSRLRQGTTITTWWPDR